MMDEAFLQPEDVSRLTGVSVAALAQLRHRGSGPKYYKPTPRKVIYKQSEVLAWIEGSARTGTTSTAFA